MEYALPFATNFIYVICTLVKVLLTSFFQFAIHIPLFCAEIWLFVFSFGVRVHSVSDGLKQLVRLFI